MEGAFDYLDASVRRIAAAEVPLPYAKPLELAALPDANDLIKVIHELLDAHPVHPVHPIGASMPDVVMPRLSDTMTEGVLSRWVKKKGDTVKRGDVLAEIETDKAVMELEVYDAGVLERLLVAEGTEVSHRPADRRHR